MDHLFGIVDLHKDGWLLQGFRSMKMVEKEVAKSKHVFETKTRTVVWDIQNDFKEELVKKCSMQKARL